MFMYVVSSNNIQEFKDTTWQTIVDTIQVLVEGDYIFVSGGKLELHTLNNEAMMIYRGKEDVFWVGYASPKDRREVTLFNPDSKGVSAVMVIGGEVEEITDDFLVPKSMALQALKTFYEDQKLDDSLLWDEKTIKSYSHTSSSLSA